MLLFQMRKENLTSNEGESYHPRGFTWKCPSKQDNRNLELQSLVLRRKKVLGFSLLSESAVDDEK